MGFEEENVKEILKEYDFLRAKAENQRDRYVKKLYDEFPRLSEIEHNINKAGFENTKKIMENPKKSKEFNKEFNTLLKELNKERDKILKENKIDKDFSVPKYQCRLCNDTGYVDNKKCVCFKQKLIEKAYSEANLSRLLGDHTFDNFSLDYYSPKKKSGETISDRENIEGILNVCKNFCKNFDNEEKNLLMIGKPGLGKTFLSNCIAREVLNSSKTVMYIRATTLFSAYEDYRFNRTGEEGFDFEKLYNSDLLIIDDLGTENITKSGISFLFDFMNERIDKNKKMIINTNFTMKEISSTYSARITSRIYEFFKILHFKGEDIRILKLKQ